jgi:DNA-binding response OmpR family regulator
MTNPEQLTILLAEDSPVTVAMISKFIERFGHKLLVAENGQQAIELFKQSQPDLIFMDMNMPIVNGIDAIKAIRECDVDVWIPIVILSALSSDSDILAGFEAGADDYLTKPVNLDVLSAKLKAMHRVVMLQKQNKHAALCVLESNMRLEQENALAKNLADRMLDFGDLTHPSLSHWLQPNQNFSGDLIAAKETIGGKLYVMLADSTGHGLTAALPTLMIARTFNAMTSKGYSLSSIVSEMNKAAKQVLPVNRFVALSLFAIDFRQRTIESWVGGMPSSLLIDKWGEIIHQFDSNHLAIGILPQDCFNAATDFYQWDKDCELIMYSDGVIDAENPSNEAYGKTRLVDTIRAGQQGQRVDAIKQSLLAFLAADNGKDDISLLSVVCESES